MNRFQDLRNPTSLRSRMRRKRVKHLVQLVRQIVEIEKKEEISILDIGGNYRYWNVFPFELFASTKFQITLVNISEKRIFEKTGRPNVEFRARVGDACNLADIADGQFDISHSNSVIEHVGSWENIKRMRDELIRTGKYHFIQTPNFWFPVEPHYMLPFIHFLPRPWYVGLLMRIRKINFDKATANFDSHRMLSKKEFAWLFPECRMITERFWLLPKSYIAVSRFGRP